jgi:hypothetical protein
MRRRVPRARPALYNTTKPQTAVLSPTLVDSQPMAFFREFARWFRAGGQWLMRARPVWRPVGAVLLTLAVACLVPTFIPPKDPDDRLRYFGLAFQLLGILTVVRGLRARERLFGVRSLGENISQWWASRPRWGARPQSIELSGAGTLGMVGSEARLSTWRRTLAGADISARVAALEGNVDSLRADIRQHDEDIREERQRRSEAVESERQIRAAADREMQTRLEGLGASGIHVEWAGVFWLIVGTVLATIPGETARALRLLLRCVPGASC